MSNGTVVRFFIFGGDHALLMCRCAMDTVSTLEARWFQRNYEGFAAERADSAGRR